MSLSMLDDDEYERQNSQSALDLSYWILTYWSQSYGRSVAFSPHDGNVMAGVSMMQAALHAFNQIGVDVPNDIEVFREMCSERPVPLADALHTRGAFLFKDQSMVFCLGDRERIMEYLGGDYIVRYLSYAERTEEFWDLVALVPGVIYA